MNSMHGLHNGSKKSSYDFRDFQDSLCKQKGEFGTTTGAVKCRRGVHSGNGRSVLTLASVTLNSLRMYWGMLYSAMGSTTKYWYLADLSAGQYWWHFSCSGKKGGKSQPNVFIHSAATSTEGPRAAVARRTLPISRSLVSMTTMVELCSQSILQKSSVVSARGPCVAM